MGSDFIVLSFGDLGEPDMVYVDHALGAAHLEKASARGAAKAIFDRLRRSDALSPADSVALIRRLVEQDAGPRGDERELLWTTACWLAQEHLQRNNGGNGCVEFAELPDGGVAIRDTKDRSQPALRYTAQEWTAFLAGVRAGEFDLT